jgi:hypothetical protein
MRAMKCAIAIAVLLCGCGHTHSRLDVGGNAPQGSAHVHIEGGRSFAALLGLSLLAVGAYEAERAGHVGDTRYVPELDPNRKVSEQDCTKPLDYSLGNIRCK